MYHNICIITYVSYSQVKKVKVKNQTLAQKNFFIKIHHFHNLFTQKTKSISVINSSKIHQQSIFLPFSGSSSPALHAQTIHLFKLLVNKLQKTHFFWNFKKKNRQKVKKVNFWKISPQRGQDLCDRADWTNFIYPKINF